MVPGAQYVMMDGLMWMLVFLADNLATPDSVSDLFTWFVSHNYHCNSFVLEALCIVIVTRLLFHMQRGK